MKTFINRIGHKSSQWLKAGLGLFMALSTQLVSAQTKNYATGNVTGNIENMGSIIGFDSPGSSGISAPLLTHSNGTINTFRFYYGSGILNSGSITSPATLTASRAVSASIIGINLLTLAGGDPYVQFRYPSAIGAGTTSYIKLGTKPTSSGLAIPVGGLLSLGANTPFVGELLTGAGAYTLGTGNGNANEGTVIGGTFETKLLVDPTSVWHAAITPTSTTAGYNSVRLKTRIPADLLGLNVTNRIDATVFNAFTFSAGGAVCSSRPAFSDEGNIAGLVTLNLSALKLVTLNQIVNNPVGAIDNSTTTYSSFSTGVANAGVAATVSQNIYFDHTASATDGATINMSLSTGLLNLEVLGGGITFRAFKGLTPVGTDQTVQGTLLGLNLADIVTVNGYANINTTFKPGAEFDRVEISLSGGVVDLGVLSDAARIYDVQLSAAAPVLTSSLALGANNSLTVYAGQPLPTITATSTSNTVLWYDGADAELTSSLNSANLPVTSIPNAGIYTYYAAARRPGCTNNSAKIPVTITVLPLTKATLPNGTLSTTYTFGSPVATSTGRTLTYAYTGTGLQGTGLSVNPTTGILSGTPLKSGTFTFDVKITDTTGGGSIDAGTYSFTVTIVTNLAIVGGPYPSGRRNSAYSQQLPNGLGASQGIAPYTYVIIPPGSGGARVDGTLALPAGLTLSSAGLLSGTPTEVGTNTFTVQATDAEGSTIQANFTVQIEEALPVTLVSFSTTKEGQSALLKWSTSAETNSDRFEIERSQNGKSWGMIGTRKSNGESLTLKNYNFTDSEPLGGENLYRLKMVDYDGTFAYSKIESVTFEGVSTSFYPNPVAEKLVINTTDISKVKTVQIFDASGRSVYQSSIPTKEINVQNFASGLYIIKMTQKNGTVVSSKIVKQ